MKPILWKLFTSFGFIFARYGVVRKGGLGEANLRGVIYLFWLCICPLWSSEEGRSW